MQLEGWKLPQDEWTTMVVIHTEMRYRHRRCCSAISHHSGPGGPQWAARAPLMPHLCLLQPGGPQCSVRVATATIRLQLNIHIWSAGRIFAPVGTPLPPPSNKYKPVRAATHQNKMSEKLFQKTQKCRKKEVIIGK